MKENISFRTLEKQDCEIISTAFHLQGFDKPRSQYEDYFNFQEEGLRDVILAEVDGQFAGYLCINWVSEYDTFRDQKIPEIVDFNVLKKFQRKGIGSALMDEAERRIKKRSDYAGIGFGVYKDYGAAQILYIRRGYVPDGNGLIKDSVPVEFGDLITIDHGVVFFLLKKL